jgi:polyribonucleotide nucleotidyltransferase
VKLAELMINPTFENRDVSDFDLVISGTQAATVMVEAGANEV